MTRAGPIDAGTGGRGPPTPTEARTLLLAISIKYLSNIGTEHLVCELGENCEKPDRHFEIFILGGRLEYVAIAKYIDLRV